MSSDSKDVKICGCMRKQALCIWLAQTHEVAPNGCLRKIPNSKSNTLCSYCSVDHLNASARSLTDRFAVLDTRGKGPIRDRIQWLALENFSGINGDGTLNLHGFDIRADENSDTLHVLVINHRPPIDPSTGKVLDATVIGANTTIEHFITKVGAPNMRYIRTTIDPLIDTPNNVAWVSEDGFVLSNDHSAKVGVVSVFLSKKIHV
jgi:arylesterase/paraoxonase